MWVKVNHLEKSTARRSFAILAAEQVNEVNVTSYEKNRLSVSLVGTMNTLNIDGTEEDIIAVFSAIEAALRAHQLERKPVHAETPT